MIGLRKRFSLGEAAASDREAALRTAAVKAEGHPCAAEEEAEEQPCHVGCRSCSLSAAGTFSYALVYSCRLTAATDH